MFNQTEPYSRYQIQGKQIPNGTPGILLAYPDVSREIFQ